jgi:hypothetical protein
MVQKKLMISKKKKNVAARVQGMPEVAEVARGPRCRDDDVSRDNCCCRLRGGGDGVDDKSQNNYY